MTECGHYIAYKMSVATKPNNTFTRVLTYKHDDTPKSNTELMYCGDQAEPAQVPAYHSFLSKLYALKLDVSNVKVVGSSLVRYLDTVINIYKMNPRIRERIAADFAKINLWSRHAGHEMQLYHFIRKWTNDLQLAISSPPRSLTQSNTVNRRYLFASPWG